ncbi:MAG: hypothetical protein HC933_07825 [Pleurocapsa sp. SU_196_0]|nr:hypothetical protein [Pleurocapsa sp. SU_196_0]
MTFGIISGNAVTLPPLNSTEMDVLRRPVPHDDRAHVTHARSFHRRAYVKWTRDEDALLRRLFMDGHPTAMLMCVLERNGSGIKARLKKLGLVVIHAPETNHRRVPAQTPEDTRGTPPPTSRFPPSHPRAGSHSPTHPSTSCCTPPVSSACTAPPASPRAP